MLELRLLSAPICTVNRLPYLQSRSDINITKGSLDQTLMPHVCSPIYQFLCALQTISHKIESILFSI